MNRLIRLFLASRWADAQFGAPKDEELEDNQTLLDHQQGSRRDFMSASSKRGRALPMNFISRGPQ